MFIEVKMLQVHVITYILYFKVLILCTRTHTQNAASTFTNHIVLITGAPVPGVVHSNTSRMGVARHSFYMVVVETGFD